MGPEPASVSGWRIERTEAITWVVCEGLLAVRGVGHAFSTRVGDGETNFDLGAHEDLDPAYEGRRRLLCNAAGLDDQRPLVLRQVHGDRIVRAIQAASSEPPAADGILCSRGEIRGFAAAVRTADCVPLLLADTAGQAVAAVHAGWRGTAESIAARAVGLLETEGIPAERLVAAVGPAIGPCCYEVGREVVERVVCASGVALETVYAWNGTVCTLDLPKANRLQLRHAGMHDSAVQIAPWCTACHDDLFFSYRRSGGPTGRLMACIGWTGTSPAP